MNASLDTCAIIHIYRADIKDVLLNRFNKIYVYKFIREVELKNHGEDILDEFDKDVEEGKLILIEDDFLFSIGMKSSFIDYVQDGLKLYNYEDMGEIYAISLAKTLGCVCLVTDDIKEYGPYFSLINYVDSTAIPLTFFDLLILDLLEGKLNNESFLDSFRRVNSNSGLRWNWKKSLRLFVTRFLSDDPYSDREIDWMDKFCEERDVTNPKKVLKSLRQSLDENFT